MSDSSQTLCKIPLHSINLTHLILIGWVQYISATCKIGEGKKSKMGGGRLPPPHLPQPEFVKK